MVFDESLPLRAPSKPENSKARYSPDYDPDTTDLFGDDPHAIDDAVTDELRNNAGDVIDDLVSEYSAEIAERLRTELTSQLAAILEDLNHRDEQP